MKLKCIRNKTLPSSGFLGLGAHGGELIEGLTPYRVYEGQVINILSNGAGSFPISNELKFLVFSDNKKWESFDIELFEPFND